MFLAMKNLNSVAMVVMAIAAVNCCSAHGAEKPSDSHQVSPSTAPTTDVFVKY